MYIKMLNLLFAFCKQFGLRSGPTKSWDFFEESKRLLYFVLGMYGEDENGCWQPWNRGRHQL